MRKIKQIAFCNSEMFALTEDGIAWRMHWSCHHIDPEFPEEDTWEPIKGPPDGDPFGDKRDVFQKFEDELK